VWRSLWLAAALLVFAPRPCAAQLCTVSTLGVSFGTYDPLAVAPLDGLGSVGYDCLLPLFGGTITINLGPGSSADITARTMKLLTQPLSYNLYTDAARLHVWGNGTIGSNVTRSIPAGILTSGSVPVYGRVTARQSVSAGLYLDAIVVTIIF
jgi:spore coat protein U-like protein